MKLRALRVASFRRFNSPVAIDDISDGINVLAAPNEAGKSTLFVALEAAFLRSYKSGAAVIKGFQPYGGGDPRVEVDFEIDATTWRLSKQFGRGGQTVLSNLTRGRDVAHNSDAESEVDRLIGKSGDHHSPFALLWVRQQAGLEPPLPDVDAATGKVRARGDVATLRDAISQEINAVTGGALFDAVESKTTAALGTLVTAGRATPKAHGPLDVAIKARDAAARQFAEAEAAAAESEKRMADIDLLKKHIAEIENPEVLAARVREKDRLQLEVNQVASVRTALAAAETTAKQHELMLEKSRHSLAMVEALAAELAIMRQGLEKATVLDSDIRQMSSALNAEPVTRAAIDNLTRSMARHDVLEAQLRAGAAAVTVRLGQAHNGRVRIDGRALEDDETIDVVTQTAIDVADVARIEIAMPDGLNTERALSEKEGLAKEIAAQMVRLKVASRDEAQTRLEAREQLSRDLDDKRRLLAATAPDGVARLKLAVEERMKQRDGSDVEALRADCTKNTERHQQAIVALEALREKVPSDADVAALNAKLHTVSAEIESHKQRATDIRLRLERLVGEQAGADNDGRASQVPAARDAMTVAQAEVDRVQQDVAALQRLAVALGEARTQQREVFATPITTRLLPKLQRLLAADGMHVNEMLHIEGLSRDGVDEPIAALSDGTREQIGILARLAIAELLGATGTPVPLILDDPLAYADESRVQVINDELTKSVETSGGQTIILTCRPGVFETLSGQRLVIAPW